VKVPAAPPAPAAASEGAPPSAPAAEALLDGELTLEQIIARAESAEPEPEKKGGAGKAGR